MVSKGSLGEAYAHVVDDSSQNGYLVQSFSEGTSSSVACGEYCQERDIHSVIAATVDELKTSYGDDSAWAGLYPRDGNHVIRFYADGRNNSDGGVGGGPSHGRYSKRTELSMTGQTAVSAMARSGSTPQFLGTQGNLGCRHTTINSYQSMEAVWWWQSKLRSSSQFSR